MEFGYNNEVELTLFDRDGNVKKQIRKHNALTRVAKKLLMHHGLNTTLRSVSQVSLATKFAYQQIPATEYLLVSDKDVTISDSTKVAPYLDDYYRELDKSIVGYYKDGPTAFSANALLARPDRALYGDNYITSCFILDSTSECDIRSLSIGNGRGIQWANKYVFKYVMEALNIAQFSNNYFIEYLPETTKVWSGWIENGYVTQLMGFDTTTSKMEFVPFNPTGSWLTTKNASCNTQRLGDVLFEINGGANLTPTNVTLLVYRGLLSGFADANFQLPTQTVTLDVSDPELDWPTTQINGVWSPIAVCKPETLEVDLFISAGPIVIDGVTGYNLYKFVCEFDSAIDLVVKSSEKIGFFKWGVTAPVNALNNTFISKTGFYDYAKNRYWLPIPKIYEAQHAATAANIIPGVILDESYNVVDMYYSNAQNVLFPIRRDNDIKMYCPADVKPAIVDISDCISGINFDEVIHKDSFDFVQILYKMELV